MESSLERSYLQLNNKKLWLFINIAYANNSKVVISLVMSLPFSARMPFKSRERWSLNNLLFSWSRMKGSDHIHTVDYWLVRTCPIQLSWKTNQKWDNWTHTIDWNCWYAALHAYSRQPLLSNFPFQVKTPFTIVFGRGSFLLSFAVYSLLTL